MNQITLSLRAADEHQGGSRRAALRIRLCAPQCHETGPGEDHPLTVKASRDLATTLATELRKGVAFVVEGQLAYFRNPETNRETYSILADHIADITPPKSCKPMP
jgi:single-stranded DNA-binding protein